MKKYILIIVFLFNDLFAGCLSCWNLHRVKITLIDRIEYDLYIQWNDEWLNHNDYLNKDNYKFPEIILKDSQHKFLSAYRSCDLRRVKYPKEGLIVSLSDRLKISYKNIVSMKAVSGRYDGYSGAGFLNTVSLRIFKLLLTPPFSQIHQDELVTDHYWLSYNHKYDENYLLSECKVPLKNQKGYFQDLWQRDIIFIAIGYD